jgi:hypothetical protein
LENFPAKNLMIVQWKVLSFSFDIVFHTSLIFIGFTCFLIKPWDYMSLKLKFDGHFGTEKFQNTTNYKSEILKENCNCLKSLDRTMSFDCVFLDFTEILTILLELYGDRDFFLVHKFQNIHFTALFWKDFDFLQGTFLSSFWRGNSFLS